MCTPIREPSPSRVPGRHERGVADERARARPTWAAAPSGRCGRWRCRRSPCRRRSSPAPRVSRSGSRCAAVETSAPRPDPRAEQPQPGDGVERGVERVGERQAHLEQRVGDPLAQPERGAGRVHADGRARQRRRGARAPRPRRPSARTRARRSAAAIRPASTPNAEQRPPDEQHRGQRASRSRAPPAPTRPASAAARCRARPARQRDRRRSIGDQRRVVRCSCARRRARPSARRRGTTCSRPSADCSPSIAAGPMRRPGSSTEFAPTHGAIADRSPARRRPSRPRPTTGAAPRRSRRWRRRRAGASRGSESAEVPMWRPRPTRAPSSRR